MPLLISRVLGEVKEERKIREFFPSVEWIGEVCGRVHDNNIIHGPRHLTYAVCGCNLGRISRFKELGVSHLYWIYLWEVI